MFGKSINYAHQSLLWHWDARTIFRATNPCHLYCTIIPAVSQQLFCLRILKPLHVRPEMLRFQPGLLTQPLILLVQLNDRPLTAPSQLVVPGVSRQRRGVLLLPDRPTRRAAATAHRAGAAEAKRSCEAQASVKCFRFTAPADGSNRGFEAQRRSPGNRLGFRKIFHRDRIGRGNRFPANSHLPVVGMVRLRRRFTRRGPRGRSRIL